MNNSNPYKRSFPWYILPLTAILLVYFWSAFFYQIHDFSNYYYSAKMVMENAFHSNIYFPAYFNQWASKNSGDFYFMSYAPNTPFLALFYAPFTLIPLITAKLLSNFISIGLLTITLIRIKNHFNISHIWIIAFPIVFLIAIKNNLLFGQPYFILLFLLSEGLISYSNHQNWSSSFWWGLAIAIKFFPVIIIGFLLAKREFKSAISLTITTVLLLCFSIIFVGLDPWLFWLEQVLPRFNKGEIAGPFVDNYQSLFMFLKHLLIYDSTWNPTGIGMSIKTLYSLVLGFKAIVITATFYISRKEKNLLFSFGIWFFSGVLISPYGSTYSLLTLLFLFLSIHQITIKNRWKMVLLAAVILTLYGSLSSTLNFPFNYLKLGGLIVGFTSICGAYWWDINRKHFFFLVLVIFGLGILSLKNNASLSTHLIPSPILTFEYEIHENELTYEFWNNKGHQKTTIPLQIKSSSTTEVEIKNQQVFYKNEQVTFTNSNKKNAQLINGNQILFLSDEEVGIGFYQLRIIDIEQ